MRRILPNSFYNPLTLAGGLVAGISFGLILFLMLLEMMSGSPKPYMGIIAFVILPAILVLGLIVAASGVWREHRRARAGKQVEHHLPQVDFNNPRHRAAFGFVAAGTVLLLVFSAFGSFQAYEHTDSDQFCGETCHTVMEPEYTAYQYSPHARVDCVKCHIGPGAGWFVRSKLSGTYQLYAVTFNKFPRPIPTPIENLRPAQETCEQCHWPKEFFSEKEIKNTYFMPDEKNSRFSLNLLIKIGGGNAEAGPTSGIHWHMNIANEVTYVPADSSRQVIPWVRSKHPDGTVTVYKSTESTLTDEELAKHTVRRMDCIDCHNRPTHIYNPPARTVNHEMELGWIDPALPGVKALAVRTLEYPYSGTQSAMDSIKLTVEQYYASTYPAVADTGRKAIERTVDELRKIYSRNYFPFMRVNWRTYPDNIGHMYSPGCFRCHDGKHITDRGVVLSKDCNMCHTILAQQFQQDTLRISLTGIDYRHPADVGDAWKETNCNECHNSN